MFSVGFQVYCPIALYPDEMEQEREISLWRQPFDEMILEGNQQPLLQIFKGGGLQDLTDEDKEEIFDAVVEKESTELIWELVKRELPIKKREVALTFALNTKNFAFIKDVIEGNERQASLDFVKWCGDKPLLAIQTFIEKGFDPEIISYLCSISSLDQKDLNDAEWRQFLSDLWGFNKDQFKIKNEDIVYEGAFIYSFLERMQKSLNAFGNTFFESSENELFLQLSQLMANSKKEISSKERWARFKEGLPILIHAGCDTQPFEVVLWRNRLLMCDNGLFSIKPVTIYRMDGNKVTEKLIEDIRVSVDTWCEEESMIFFKKFLLDMLSCQADKCLTSLMHRHWINENLTGENKKSAWKNVWRALISVAGMHYWWKEECDQVSKRLKQTHAIKSAFEKMMLWDCYNRFWCLKAYLEHSTQDLSRMDRKLLDRVFTKAKERFYQPRKAAQLTQSEECIYKRKKSYYQTLMELEKRYHFLKDVYERCSS